MRSNEDVLVLLKVYDGLLLEGVQLKWVLVRWVGHFDLKILHRHSHINDLSPFC
jgi:hypothetical protein